MPPDEPAKEVPAMKSAIPLVATLLLFLGPPAGLHTASPPAFAQELSSPMPLDPGVRTGSYDNGLRFFIKVNKEPENRAQIWLAVNAGSVLEDDDQQGLAHFVEHMSFNGTEHFSKNELIHYMESIGMRFGPEVNAFTSFDETVYMLEVPTDTTEMVETAFQILEDWSHLLRFDEEEIDKERGVIGEEWRLGRGAQMRMLDKQLPVLFKGSKYANRLTIGQKAVIDTCHYDTLRRFYTDWYRPDLMAVIAVGDFDPDWIEGLVEKHFSALPAHDSPRARETFSIPDHDETLVSVVTDPEATHTTVTVMFKSDLVPMKTIADFRRHLTERLHDDMLNDRLVELTKEAEPPFLFAFMGEVPIVRTRRLQMVAAVVNQDGIEAGLEALLIEATRASRHGFTATELGRSKAELTRNIEKAYNEKDKTKSAEFSRELLNLFLRETAAPGIDYEYEMAMKLLPEITLAEINQIAASRVGEKNRVVLAGAPEKEDVAVPMEEDLVAVFERVEKAEIEPYVDKALDQPLVAEEPEAGEIVEEFFTDELGVTQWTLSNGLRVFLKPTDFKNDEILFYAYSPGGVGLAADDIHVSAEAAAMVVNESGVGEFNSVELEKKLSDKVVTVDPYIGYLREGLSGSASPQDMETMFQLIYLYVTAPRKDADAFESFLTKMEGVFENRSASPEAAFYDTLQVTLAQGHHRARPWNVDILKEIRIDDAYDFYTDRFSDAGDFVFFFVGNFTPEEIRPHVMTYLGGLPSTDRKESWADMGITPPKGVVEKTVEKGIEEKGQVAIVFTGAMDWTPERKYALGSLAEVMEIDLREMLREDLGGTYGVSINYQAEQFPREEYQLQIAFGCDPGRIEELTQAVFVQVDSLLTYGPDPDYVDRVRESQLRAFETNMKENRYWLGRLHSRHFAGEDLAGMLRDPELVQALSMEMIKEAAADYLNVENYVRVVLVPED
jgi:zinc protease